MGDFLVLKKYLKALGRFYLFQGGGRDYMGGLTCKGERIYFYKIELYMFFHVINLARFYSSM